MQTFADNGAATTASPTFEQPNQIKSGGNGEDQELESSINQENKFANNRFNQIGEEVDEEFVAAIQAISKAPLPVPITTTRYIGGSASGGQTATTTQPRRKVVKHVAKVKVAPTDRPSNLNQLETVAKEQSPDYSISTSKLSW